MDETFPDIRHCFCQRIHEPGLDIRLRQVHSVEEGVRQHRSWNVLEQNASIKIPTLCRL